MSPLPSTDCCITLNPSDHVFLPLREKELVENLGHGFKHRAEWAKHSQKCSTITLWSLPGIACMTQEWVSSLVVHLCTGADGGSPGHCATRKTSDFRLRVHLPCAHQPLWVMLQLPGSAKSAEINSVHLWYLAEIARQEIFDLCNKPIISCLAISAIYTYIYIFIYLYIYIYDGCVCVWVCRSRSISQVEPDTSRFEQLQSGPRCCGLRWTNCHATLGST